ncbi:MAG: hypothetical protein KF795_22855 [Labilithrix sp.]|nr:hypothetical protein [Labilithrix sp.]
MNAIEKRSSERLVGALLYAATPWHWPELLRRIRNNPAFFADLLEYANADPDTRRRALRRVVRHLYRKALEGDVKGWRTSTKGFAAELLDGAPWLSTQLGSTPHLGALEDASANISRLDYSLLINHVLLAMKKELAGYGIGASIPELRKLPSGREMSRLAVAQSWSFLLNAGHLFGTFATERGLFFELVRDGYVDVFLSEIVDRLRPHAAAIIDARGLNQFHYALACWRVSRAPMSDALRADCVVLLEEFFRCRALADAPAHYWAFRAARQLAYNRLHLYMGIGHPVEAVSDDAVVRALSPWGSLGYESSLVEESSPLSSLLDDLDRYQSDNHFASAETASIVLAHVRAFREWWKSNRSDLPTAVDGLFGKPPPDWPVYEREELTHFSRVHLLGEPPAWLEEVRRWKDESSVSDAWASAFFLVSPRARRGLVCDLYLRRTSVPAAAFLHQVALRVAAHCEASWTSSPDAERREVWRSVAAFGLRAFSELASDNCQAVMRPAAIDLHGSTGHVGYAVLSKPAASALGRARELVDQMSDPIRQRELRATIRVVEETARSRPDDPLLLFLGSTYLVERKRQQKNLAEFDGAWCFFGKDKTSWFLLEHKKGHRAEDPEGALTSKLRHLRGSWSRHVVETTALGGDVSVVSC